MVAVAVVVVVVVVVASSLDRVASLHLLRSSGLFSLAS